MKIKNYLKRIKYDGIAHLDAESLRDLQLAHLYAVPFENHSIHTGEQIKLDFAWLYGKIVTRGRGGFCYECNGLFSWLLNEIGFKVTLLSARVWNEEKQALGEEFDHMALRVDLDEPWLVDVGFGDNFRHPLRLNERGEQTDPWGVYQLRKEGESLVYWRKTDDTWQKQYVFTLAPRALDDYKKMCHFHQTSWQSHFTRQKIASLATPRGRVSLSGEKLIETIDGKRTERILMGDEVTEMVLQEYFGIVLKNRSNPETQGYE